MADLTRRGAYHKTMHTIPESLAGNVPGVSGSRHARDFRWAIITGALALALVTPGAGFAAEPVSNALILPSLKTDWRASSAVEPVSTAPVSSSQELDWSTGSGKSYLIPALEIPAFLWLLNRFDRAVYGD